ncbi:MFS general substrate transporter [Mytilinidion resinicola]|uniref:MFS general substrate transporter n=1 Tax=Mytilinidion resinicola TaxID=574789 RepID=A0A6A6YFV8_9PEZI|nr:MFS general substrate transporter [Mytilinidion resinicola]KAF2807706.1 MFS general substrate transporter [Mytilinidion resinicola]
MRSGRKQLLWKIDGHLLPWVVLMYLTNFLDRNALAKAHLGSLEADLHLKGTDFNTIISILFIGYILLCLCGMMAIWGMISACQAATHSYVGELMCPLFLGAAEAPFFSWCIFLMSSWYRAHELAHRLAIFYTGVALANMFGRLIAASILANLNPAHGIAEWRWLFIIEGTATCAQDVQGEQDDRDAITWKQALKLAYSDYRLYLFMIMHHYNLLAQSFTYFFPTIVKSLGYNSTTTFLLTVSVWFATLIATLLVAYHSSATSERSIHIACCMAVGAIGNILVVTTHGMILAWITSLFPRPLGKRAVVVATCGMFGNAAGIYGSYMYPPSNGPQYVPAGVGLACVCFLCAGMAMVIRCVLGRENKKLAAKEQEEGLPKRFRYIL